MKHELATFLFLIVFTACDSGRTEHSESGSAPVVEDENIVSNEPVVLKGLYISSNKGDTFSDCAGHKTYRLRDNTGKLDSLYAKTTLFASYPGESIYLELKGYVSGKSTNESNDYENILIVTGILKTESKNYRTECYPYEFIALGNEPFWSVDIIPDENRIILKDMSTEKVFDFAYKPANKTADTYLYEMRNEKGETIKIQIRQETCSDGMSDRSYLYRSEVNINGRILRGCAIKKGEQFSDPA